MTVTVTPADLFDLAELGGAASRAQWRLVKDLAGRGDTYALRQHERLIGLAFFVPIGAGIVEANFNPAPAASRSMLGIVRAARLTIEAAPYPAIVTICRSAAGKRFAALAGFHPIGTCARGEVWIHGRCADGGNGAAPAAQCGQVAAAAEGTDCPVATPEPGAAGGRAG